MICLYIPALGQFVFYYATDFTPARKGAIPEVLEVASCVYVGYDLGSRAEDYIREELRKRMKDWQYAFYYGYVDIYPLSNTISPSWKNFLMFIYCNLIQ